MSFSFSSMFTTIENAVKTAAPVVEAAIPVAEGAASIVAATVPSTAGVITTVETVAPAVVNDVSALVGQGKSLLANPAVAELESIFAQLVHWTSVPQGGVVTPTSTAATVPAK